MVAPNPRLASADWPKFFAEVRQALSRCQPNLRAKLGRDSISITGVFVCSGPDGPFDAYDIEIDVRQEFPISEPSVREVGGRIPQDLDHHIDYRGNCCLCVWPRWLHENPQPSFQDFLDGPLQDFFVSQWHFRNFRTWPYGERAHGDEGIKEAYAEILGFPDGSDLVQVVSLLDLETLRGHHYCPCPSGKRLRDCHLKQLLALRAELSPLIRFSMTKWAERSRNNSKR